MDEHILEKDNLVKYKRGQSILESVIVFAVGTMIIAAMTNLFVWGISHIPIRQATYEATRVIATQPTRNVDEEGAKPASKRPLWPTYVVSAAGAY